jgi:phytoene synthase
MGWSTADVTVATTALVATSSSGLVAASDGALAASAADLETCRALLAAGSKSFHAASWLLPRALRGPAAAVYGFCRVSDDAVDEAEARGADPIAELQALHERLDAIYAGRPADDPVDRAFAVVVARYGIPRAAPEGLLDGYRWDVEGRRYRQPGDTVAYGARVASTVGLMMTALMGIEGPRGPVGDPALRRQVFARACDLGIAMQLTNIARDVGEDARSGRVYLPEDWLAHEGLSAARLIEAPAHSPALGRVVERLLGLADTYYERADRGIPWLPWRARLAIRAASLIYRDIGRVVRANGHDAVSQRAVTSLPRKLWLLGRALGAAFWRRRPPGVEVDPAVEFLLPAPSEAP